MYYSGSGCEPPPCHGSIILHVEPHASGNVESRQNDQCYLFIPPFLRQIIAEIVVITSSNIANFYGKRLTVLCSELKNLQNLSGDDMQRINEIVSELKTIMQDTGISQTSVVSALDGKCARNTILTFLKGGEDCKLSTLLMILDACGVELRLDTERSKEAILSGDIAAYRTEVEQMRTELDKETSDKEFYKSRYEELIDKNTSLTNTIAKQQSQIERYMDRMEKAENALYAANDDVRRKDAKIVELLKEAKKW